MVAGGRYAPVLHHQGLPLVRASWVYALAKQGILVGLTEEIYLHRSALEEAKRLIKEELTHRGQMRLSEMREAWGTTRKFAVPLAEYFDRIGFTQRQGDERMLVQGQ